MPPPPGLPRWSEGFCTRGETAPTLFLSTSPRSTETSSVGAGRSTQPLLAEASAPPRQARWGRDAEPSRCLQKPPLHRDKLGGGGTLGPAVACAEASAPPGQARWGRDASRTRAHPPRAPLVGKGPLGVLFIFSARSLRCASRFRGRSQPSPRDRRRMTTGSRYPPYNTPSMAHLVHEGLELVSHGRDRGTGRTLVKN